MLRLALTTAGRDIAGQATQAARDLDPRPVLIAGKRSRPRRRFGVPHPGVAASINGRHTGLRRCHRVIGIQHPSVVRDEGQMQSM